MKFDDASWHSDGNFPTDVPYDNGATHIAVFYVWCINHDLADTRLLQETELVAIRNRTITPTEFFLRACDGKLIDEDLSARGVAFASSYYVDGNEGYFNDYANLDYGKTAYHAPASWEPYDRMAATIRSRYAT